jgi:hypothetical protein
VRPPEGEHRGVNPDISELLDVQARLISRRQVLELGLQPHDIKRMLRRDWRIVHPGVYVAHTGPLGWLERAWAAVLFSWPAALWGDSAIRGAEGPGRTDEGEQTIHVAVDRWRSSLVAPEGVRLHHVTRLGSRVQWNMSPPRMRYEEAALDLATEATSDFRAIAALAKACQSRRTTARRLLTSLASPQRNARRAWLRDTLTDIAEGTCSVLEHGYLVRVERAHGLAHGSRQVRATASVGLVYRDVEYDKRLVVELDGRLFHDTATQRDADFERDLDAAVDGRATVRVSYGQVFDRPCSTAGKLGALMRAHGMTVRPKPCAPTCALAGLGKAA